MSNDNFEIIKHFGPSIIKTKIPEKMVEEINAYVDEMSKNKEKLKKLDHGDNLVADVTQEFRLEKEFMDKIGWLNFLAEKISKWVFQETGDKMTQFKMKNTWVVRQFKDQFNPTHWHYGHISGAGFLKVPKSLGKFSQNKPSNTYRGGHLEFLHGSRMFLNKSVYHAIPEVGDFYIFPNYLMHHVWPFKDTDEERRSISFNAEIDEKIYNVYSR